MTTTVLADLTTLQWTRLDGARRAVLARAAAARRAACDDAIRDLVEKERVAGGVLVSMTLEGGSRNL